MQPIRRILLANDFSTCATAAAAVTARLARQLNATVHMLTMVDTAAVMDAAGDADYRNHRIGQIRDDARARLRALAAQHLGGIDDVQLVVVDGGFDPDPAREIISAGHALGCDLIVVGTHGRTGLEHLVIGSVAERVLRTSAIPVITVRAVA